LLPFILLIPSIEENPAGYGILLRRNENLELQRHWRCSLSLQIPPIMNTLLLPVSLPGNENLDNYGAACSFSSPPTPMVHKRNSGGLLPLRNKTLELQQCWRCSLLSLHTSHLCTEELGGRAAGGGGGIDMMTPGRGGRGGGGGGIYAYGVIVRREWQVCLIYTLYTVLYTRCRVYCTVYVVCKGFF
jgi:hypothetical protein